MAAGPACREHVPLSLVWPVCRICLHAPGAGRLPRAGARLRAVGMLLVLRRMSLMGDAMSHAMLPGAAAGFLVSGLSLPAMSIGGFVAGLGGGAAGGAGVAADGAARGFELRRVLPDLAGARRAAGLPHGPNVDLMHVLFGTVLALDDDALLLIGAWRRSALLALALIWRPLVLECLDPSFCAASAGAAAGASSFWRWWC